MYASSGELELQDMGTKYVLTPREDAYYIYPMWTGVFDGLGYANVFLQHERLRALGTIAQYCQLEGFANGCVKILFRELVNLACSMLCLDHFVRLS